MYVFAARGGDCCWGWGDWAPVLTAVLVAVLHVAVLVAAVEAILAGVLAGVVLIAAVVAVVVVVVEVFSGEGVGVPQDISCGENTTF